MYLFTDHVGSRPVVYYQTESGAIVFAPELKAILRMDGEAFRPDPSAIADIFSIGYVTNRKTLVKDANLMGPGELLEVSVRGIRVSRYWEPELNEDPAERDIRFFQQGLTDVLQKAVDRHLRIGDAEETALSLSGGKDSRAILGFADRGGHTARTRAFGFSRKVGSDASLAARLSRSIGAPHLYVQCAFDRYFPYEEGSAYLHDGMRHVIGEWPLWRTLRQEHGLKVTLMGDQCFGSTRLQTDLWQQEAQGYPGVQYQVFDRQAYYAQLFRREYVDVLEEASRRTIDQLSQMTSSLRLLQNRRDYQYFEQRLFCNWNRLHYAQTVDVELRSPWLDRDVLEFIYAVPVEYRTDSKLFKKTIRDLFPNLFNIPMARSGSFPTPEQRASWLSRHREQLEGELFEETYAIDDMFDHAAVLRLVDYLAVRTNSFARKARFQDFVSNVSPMLVGPAGKAHAAFDRAKTRAPSGKWEWPSDISILHTLQGVIHVRQALRDVGVTS